MILRVPIVAVLQLPIYDRHAFFACHLLAKEMPRNQRTIVIWYFDEVYGVMTEDDVVSTIALRLLWLILCYECYI